MFEVESKFNLSDSFVSILCILLISSLFVCVFVVNAEGQDAIHVEDENALKTAITNAANGVSIVIAFDRNIALTATLTIPASKDITLTSNGNAAFSLFGAYGVSVLTVQNGGKLGLAGITVTHVSGASGAGVTINSGGTVFMSDGEISGNTYSGYGSVYNSGTFIMTGGKISNNVGAGVYNYGTNSVFTMSGGEIAGNSGAGVYNSGTFTMNYGIISNNNAGGVSSSRNFDMPGGEISNNKAGYNGGGVYISGGTFTMSGGKISGNSLTTTSTSASYGGGGVYLSGSSSTFTMSGGEISNNMAINGGGVYIADGIVRLSGGKLFGNTAINSGGGVWVSLTNLGRLFVSNGVEFSNNRASAAYDRDSSHDSIYSTYIGNNVGWTYPYTQGYNNYDISYVYGTSTTTFTVTVIDGFGTPNGAGSYSVGQTVTIDAGIRNGYTFSRWTVNSGGVSLSGYSTTPTATFTMPTNNVVVTASWNSLTYNINYELNSGSATNNPWSYNTGDLPVTITDPTRTGYNFFGWTVRYANNTEFTGQTGYSIPRGSYGNVALTANWGSANQYAITYVLNGGENAANNPTSYDVTSTQRTINNPTRAGYTFRGWTVAYTDGRAGITTPTTYYSIPSSATGNIVLTANWNLIQYTISYTLNGGTNAAGNPTAYNAESSFPIVIAKPTKAEDEFLGWTVKYADSSKTDVTNPTPSYSIPAGTIGNVALTANWAQWFTIQFVDWDGTLLKSETVLYGNSATPPANPTNEGYVFTGWDSAGGSYTSVTRDLRVTALYRRINEWDSSTSNFMVQFVNWDGRLLKSETVAYGGSATPPANPIHEGHIFTGWDNSDGSYTYVTKDLRITALYKPDDTASYTVQFVDWDGRVLKSETVLYGNSATPPANPIHEGYVFAGWDSSGGSYTYVTKNTRITALYRSPGITDSIRQLFVDGNSIEIIAKGVIGFAGAVAGLWFLVTGWIMDLFR